MKQPFYSLSCQQVMVSMRACFSRSKIELVYYYPQYFLITPCLPGLMLIICISVSQVKYVFKSQKLHMDSTEVWSWEHTHTIQILFARISTELDILFLKAITNNHIYNKKILWNSLKPSPILLSPFCRKKQNTNNLSDFTKIT